MPKQEKKWVQDPDCGLCRGNWYLEEYLMTPVGLGLKLRYNARNQGDNVIWTLLDLLNLIREIALQADCLMPFIVLLPPGRGNGLRQRQDLHRGHYLLLDKAEQNGVAWPLLNPQPVDIQLQQETYLTLSDISDHMAQKELNPALYNRLFDPFPALPEKNASQSLLMKAWEAEWKKRLHGKGTEDSASGEEGGQPADNEYLTSPAGLGRIIKCAISTFKGIRECKSVDLNADIILVTGANGSGKSSFVEALSLALTGYSPEIKQKENENDKGGIPDHFFHYGAEKFSIELEMESGQEQSKKITVSGEKGGELPSSKLRILRYPSGRISEPVPVLEELNFRLTTYLPGHVDLLFDETVSPSWYEKGEPEVEDSAEENPCMRASDEVLTVRDLFPSLPLEAEALCHAVQSELQAIDEKQKSYDNQNKEIHEQTEKILKEAGRFFKHFYDELNILLHTMGREKIAPVDGWQQQKPPPPEEFAQALEQQKEALRPALGSIGTWSSGILESGIQTLWDGYSRSIKRADITKIAGQLADKEQDLAEIIVKQVEIGHVGRLEPLLDIFSRLADESFCRESIDLLQDLDMQAVAEEIAWVEPARAHRCASELAVAGTRQVGRLQDTKEKWEKEVNRLKSRYKQIMEELPAWKSKKLVMTLITKNADLLRQLESFTGAVQKWKIAKKELENSEKQKTELQELADFIGDQRLEFESFRLAISESLNNVLKRFVMTEGLEADDVELTSEFKLRADADKKGKSHEQRDLACFSSGQKAQLAMAWMVACRELIHNEKNQKMVRFPHRVMIMDDPSTTFDLSNLHSQAILWRQLAYNENRSQRYQIFIVSHHEEFSSRLLDLLCPPGLQGEKQCRMKILRFTDWTPKGGAQLNAFDVKPASDNFDLGVKLFHTGLKYLAGSNK